jgi:hypothetical protein
MPVPVKLRNPESGVLEGREDDGPTVAVEPTRQLDGTHDGTQYAHGIQYVPTDPSSQLAVKETQHLPSPSPTPPLLSSSPPLVSDSSARPTGTPFFLPNGRRHSSSYEKSAVPVGSRENGDRMLSQPLPISVTQRPLELHDGFDENARSPRALVIPNSNGEERVLKLTAAQMEELTSAPESLPRSSLGSPVLPGPGPPPLAPSPLFGKKSHYRPEENWRDERARSNTEPSHISAGANVDRRPVDESTPSSVTSRRPGLSSRVVSTPHVPRNRMTSYSKGSFSQTSSKRRPVLPGPRPEPLDLDKSKSATGAKKSTPFDPLLSPIPPSIPLPPMSIPTYLQLELSSSQPSPLYIYRSSASENVYESSRIKFERLLNFLLLPPQLEQIIYFGTLACLDAWLYTFTILPLRFLIAVAILIRWWGQALDKEIRFITGFIYHGLGRMWHRRRGRGNSDSPSHSRSVPQGRQPQPSTPSYHPQSARTADNSNGGATTDNMKFETERKVRQGWGRKHRRVKSEPSLLLSSHKADLLQGAVIICSCMILLKLDASRMYHSIRGQAAIKLYVIYNVLEVSYEIQLRIIAKTCQVCDKLFSALGQDIFECLFSNETLERDVDGRSKILRPFGMFILALTYNVIHAAALFYQVITLNVAVNSYSNALLTLLMSNQFVEIKSSVFKKIEKDNLFQLTCADVVERFQLWLMLMVIALRNIVEVGGLSILSASGANGAESLTESIPIRSNSILPNSFTILPSWAGEVLSPFLLVLGSEMLVDWVKHAYINKFNNIKPAIYQRYLDVLAKDYYTNVSSSFMLVLSTNCSRLLRTKTLSND